MMRRIGKLMVTLIVSLAALFSVNCQAAEDVMEQAVKCYEAQEYEKALDLFAQAAGEGNLNAYYMAGYMFHYGLGTEQDYGKAAELYEYTAEKGLTDAMIQMGHLYQYGLGVEQDYQTAIAYYEDATNNGEIDGWTKIGKLYEEIEDYGQALIWYKKAADAGDPVAVNNLGMLYADGLGVEQDYAAALELFLKASEAGLVEAMMNTGYSYASGWGAERDLEAAIYWYEKVLEAGETVVIPNLAELYDLVQEYEKAREYYEIAAEAGDIVSVNNLGTLYFYGNGVEQNYTTAKSYWEKAAEAGYSIAMYNLGLLYENGLGVEQSNELAQEWYARADAAQSGSINVENNENAVEIEPSSKIADSMYTEESAKKADSYIVTVENGIGSGEYRVGDTVTIKAFNDEEETKTFVRWIVEEGEVSFTEHELTDGVLEYIYMDDEVSFVMPAENVKICAAFTEKISYEEEFTSTDISKTASSFYAGKAVHSIAENGYLSIYLDSNGAIRGCMKVYFHLTDPEEQAGAVLFTYSDRECEIIETNVDMDVHYGDEFLTGNKYSWENGKIVLYIAQLSDGSLIVKDQDFDALYQLAPSNSEEYTYIHEKLIDVNYSDWGGAVSAANDVLSYLGL